MSDDKQANHSSKLCDLRRNLGRGTACAVMLCVVAHFESAASIAWAGARAIVNLFLSKLWRGGARSAMPFVGNWEASGMSQALMPAITPEAIESIFAIAFGFAVAGLCASGYRLFRLHFPSFRLLEVGPMPARFAAVPVLMFSAPFLIMRNTLRGRPPGAAPRRIRHDRHRRSPALWSLMSGTVVVMALQALLRPSRSVGLLFGGLRLTSRRSRAQYLATAFPIADARSGCAGCRA